MNFASEVMRKNIEFCVPETRAPDMLYLMKKYDYEDLLVVDNMHDLHLVGIVHQKAISDESLEKLAHPFDVKAKNCMEVSPATVTGSSTIMECLNLMEQYHISLLPVVDSSGHCCGVVKKEDLQLS